MSDKLAELFAALQLLDVNTSMLVNASDEHPAQVDHAMHLLQLVLSKIKQCSQIFHLNQSLGVENSVLLAFHDIAQDLQNVRDKLEPGCNYPDDLKSAINEVEEAAQQLCAQFLLFLEANTS